MALYPLRFLHNHCCESLTVSRISIKDKNSSNAVYRGGVLVALDYQQLISDVQ
jgi:hypothetical protein